MKAYEFPVRITLDGRLELPNALSKLLPGNEVVRIIVLVREPTDSEEGSAWARLTTEQFSSGYSEADAIYDNL